LPSWPSRSARTCSTRIRASRARTTRADGIGPSPCSTCRDLMARFRALRPLLLFESGRLASGSAALAGTSRGAWPAFVLRPSLDLLAGRVRAEPLRPARQRRGPACPPLIERHLESNRRAPDRRVGLWRAAHRTIARASSASTAAVIRASSSTTSPGRRVVRPDAHLLDALDELLNLVDDVICQRGSQAGAFRVLTSVSRVGGQGLRSPAHAGRPGCW